VLIALSEGGLLDERSYQNLERHSHQYQLIVKINDYAWVVPFVVDGDVGFFTTLFPSRSETKRYLGKQL
jgi:hypothetical protein